MLKWAQKLHTEGHINSLAPGQFVCYSKQGWGEYYLGTPAEYYLGTRLAQNNKHEYTKNIVHACEYHSGTDFPVLIPICSVLAPALIPNVQFWNSFK